MCGRQQGIHVEVIQWVLLLLPGWGMSQDLESYPNTDCGVSLCAGCPQVCAAATGCPFSASSVELSFLWGAGEDRVGENLSSRAHTVDPNDFLMNC